MRSDAWLEEHAGSSYCFAVVRPIHASLWLSSERPSSSHWKRYCHSWGSRADLRNIFGMISLAKQWKEQKHMFTRRYPSRRDLVIWRGGFSSLNGENFNSWEHLINSINLIYTCHCNYSTSTTLLLLMLNDPRDMGIQEGPPNRPISYAP